LAVSPAFFPPGSVTAELVRSFNWSTTPIGPMSAWPDSLRTTVGLLLNSRHPMFLWWGPELIQFYNDAYLPSFGRGKHPAAMGQRGRDCWQEIWPIISPQIHDVMTLGRPSWNEDALVPIFRNGRIEEVYWTYGYSPVFREDGAVGGTLVVCTETTSRVVAQRRLESIRNLSDQAAATTDVPALLHCGAAVFAQAPEDIPFALVYALDGATSAPWLAASVGLPPDDAQRLLDQIFAHPTIWDGLISAVNRRALVTTVPGGLPGGPWPEATGALYVTPLARSTGEAFGFVVFGISPRLPWDESYRNHLEQLSKHLGVAHARIEASRVRAALLTELESASRAKDEFLAMLGHELRNPLSPIVTALQLMRLRGSSETSKEQNIIERQVGHLVRLVDDLLDVAKITRGKVELRRETVEIADVIAKAVEMASFLLEQRGHSLHIDVARSGLRWEGDPVRLAQVVANLLTNAARYTDRGGDIRVGAAVEGDQIVIRVKDNGIGITAEMLPRIFDLFTQGKRNPDRSEGGLGIGLALVKNLVAMHGGTVLAISEGHGKGSEFTVRLPRPVESGDLPALATTHPGPGTTTASVGKRVLLVDDNVDAAELLAELLSTAGHTVTIVGDPLVALTVIDDLRPDVAVLDIGLPGMDGYDLAARIRARPGTAACRFIALTGYGQEHDHLRSAAAGFTDHLVKPVDLDKLLQIIEA
jgi:signal transduction histidine kinase/CheY-like chemotaxis protein